MVVRGEERVREYLSIDEHARPEDPVGFHLGVHFGFCLIYSGQRSCDVDKLWELKVVFRLFVVLTSTPNKTPSGKLESGAPKLPDGTSEPGLFFLSTGGQHPTAVHRIHFRPMRVRRTSSRGDQSSRRQLTPAYPAGTPPRDGDNTSSTTPPSSRPPVSALLQYPQLSPIPLSGTTTAPHTTQPPSPPTK